MLAHYHLTSGHSSTQTLVHRAGFLLDPSYFTWLLPRSCFPPPSALRSFFFLSTTCCLNGMTDQSLEQGNGGGLATLSIASLRKRRGVVRASVTRTGARLKDLEDTLIHPLVLSCSLPNSSHWMLTSRTCIYKLLTFWMMRSWKGSSWY